MDVVEQFGVDILQTGKNKGEEEIDRKKLGALVFSNPSSMSVSPNDKSMLKLHVMAEHSFGFEKSMYVVTNSFSSVNRHWNGLFGHMSRLKYWPILMTLDNSIKTAIDRLQ